LQLHHLRHLAPDVPLARGRPGVGQLAHGRRRGDRVDRDDFVELVGHSGGGLVAVDDYAGACHGRVLPDRLAGHGSREAGRASPQRYERWGGAFGPVSDRPRETSWITSAAALTSSCTPKRRCAMKKRLSLTLVLIVSTLLLAQTG